MNYTFDQAVLNLFQQGISIFDQDLNLIFCNDKYLSLLDFPHQFGQSGTALADMFRYNAERGEYGTAQSVDAIVKARLAMVQSGEAQILERKRPDGTALLIQGAPIAEGGFLFIYSDITELRQIEQNLRVDNQHLEDLVQARTRELQQKKQEQLDEKEILRATVETVSHGITLFDKQLKLVICNQNFLRLLEFPDEFGIPGTDFAQLVAYNYDRGEYGTGDRAETIQAILDRTRKFEPHHFYRTRPDGTVIEIIGTPIAQGFVTTYRDVTLEKQAQHKLKKKVAEGAEALAHTYDILQNVLDTIPVRVFWKDKQAKYLGGNKLFLEFAGCQSLGDLVGKSDYDLPWTNYAANLQADDLEVITHNQPKLNIEKKCAYTQSWMRTNKVPLRSPNGEVFGILGTDEDVTVAKKQAEALQKSEARFRTLFDKTIQFSALLDAEGRILEINQTVADRFQIDKNSFAGELFHETPFWTHDPSEQDKIITAIKLARQGQESRFNTFNPAPEGGRIHIDFSIKPIFDDQGRVVLMLPEGRDITDKVLADRELFKSQQWLKAHFDHTPLGVIQWDMDYRVVAWNKAATKIFGYSAEDAQGQDASFFVEEKARPLIKCIFDSLSKGKGGFRSVNSNLTSDGRVITCEWYNTPLADRHGKVFGIASFAYDLTEKIETQAELKQSEERYKLALQAVNDGIFDWDIDEGKIFLSEAAIHILGIDKNYDLRDDQIIINKLSPDQRPHFRKTVIAHLKGQTDSFEHEMCFETPDQQIKWVLCRGLAIPSDDDRIHRMSGSVSDITRRKLAEQKVKDLNDSLEKRVKARTRELETANYQLQHTQAELIQSEKMASLGGLVSGVAHEVNTPIGVGVTAISHLLDEINRLENAFKGATLKKSDFEAFFDQAKANGNMVLSNLSRAAKLVGSFKQVAVDQSSDDLRKINIIDYVHEIFLSLTPTLKKTRVKTQIEGEEQISCIMDPGALAQIITNLVMNSLTHAYELGQTGTIALSCEEDSDGVHLLYSDDGKGMTKEVLSQIFEPFFTTRRGAGGSGLGMNIVYNLVTQRMNGKIKCISSPGNGAQFVMFFPAVKGNEV